MSEPEIKRIDVHELKKRLDADPALCIIDVRELHEWQLVHIPAAIHIPQGDLAACIEAKAPERNKAIYLHCKGGVRSLAAAQRLIEMDYQEIYSIDGGIADWIMFGYPVES